MPHLIVLLYRRGVGKSTKDIDFKYMLLVHFNVTIQSNNPHILSHYNSSMAILQWNSSTFRNEIELNKHNPLY